ncbi:DOR [Drosophila busckii]|uniref:DOR n=1 Tax=Drosophila busckii TaxID=30019 RepID=A0A0M4EMU2_DROBS|nr:uncharacterized protein LOC108600942 isoform X1 [Drosophila busckii]XP_017844271.1 uncharacterized protein LOC108600942 isoform X1 [Drosophila busckii]XP_017844272.1 uncharacterized protein LOC108600942 isoform X1 [Drosophila busckii]ALC45085.1 DOR [Drosophila busckii]
MLSSLATFLFGAQQATDTSEANAAQQSNAKSNQEPAQEPTAGDVIEVTSSTPSVAGNSRGTVQRGKRAAGKNKRGKANKQRSSSSSGSNKQQPNLSKLLSPNQEEDFDEDEWYIVEKQDEEDGESDSLPRSDSEEELSVGELLPKPNVAAIAAAAAAAARRRQHVNTHSLYSGPRPQQQRNYLQRTRAAARPLSISTLSPPRSVHAAAGDSDTTGLLISQSLYAPSLSPTGSELAAGAGAGALMEESWYVTPPPCFTSIGPINMEASPFENLLIEHPSMSVYHSIRSSQAGTESFVNLDLAAAEATESAAAVATPQAATVAVSQSQRSHSARYDRHAAAELKQQTLARQSQKSNTKKQQQQLGRSAIKRGNKVRDAQAKGQRPRRSDMQHCKLVSGANNNRKCC